MVYGTLFFTFKEKKNQKILLDHMTFMYFLQEYFSAPAWATLPNNSKVGLPLPPIPMEKHDMSLSISNSSRNGQKHRQHHHQQHRFRR